MVFAKSKQPVTVGFHITQWWCEQCRNSDLWRIRMVLFRVADIYAGPLVSGLCPFGLSA